MPPPVLAAEPSAGGADKTVASGVFVAADRGGGDGSRRADRAAHDADRSGVAFRLSQTGVMPINGKRAALRFWLCGLQTGVKFRLLII